MTRFIVPMALLLGAMGCSRDYVVEVEANRATVWETHTKYVFGETDVVRGQGNLQVELKDDEDFKAYFIQLPPYDAPHPKARVVAKRKSPMPDVHGDWCVADSTPSEMSKP